jgi:hypothetical protein
MYLIYYITKYCENLCISDISTEHYEMRLQTVPRVDRGQSPEGVC